VPIEVMMPKLSPTMESGVLSQWLVKVGDQVKEGDVLADVETDKATMPMKAFDEGTVALLDRDVGDEIQLGERVLVLAKKEEDPVKVAEQYGGKKIYVARCQMSPYSPQKVAELLGGEKPAPKASPEARDAAPHETSSEAMNVPTRPEAQGAGANGKEPSTPVAEPEPEPTPAPAGGRVKSSPLARKIAKESQVDLARIRGSGPGGRVVRNDVEAYLEARAKQPAAPAGAPSPAAPARELAAERIPHTRMRKTIAQRMVEAKKVAPEIHVAVDARVDELVAIRERLNTRLAAEKIKLSLGDFVTKAVALALRRHPGVNASFEPDAIVRHGEINIGIGVAVEAGVIVPVLRNADTLGLREIRRETEALVEAARKGKLTTEQMTGGTFSISNLGMYGVRQFDAVLNLPEVAILAVGAAEKRPVVVGDALQVGTVMTLNLTADHRAIDGAMAAEFQRTLKGLLEEPASMLL
jgi:pyruvate dehydrogenase E2 component (dihydrolipoamide acetyltransferase)